MSKFIFSNTGLDMSKFASSFHFQPELAYFSQFCSSSTVDVDIYLISLAQLTVPCFHHQMGRHFHGIERILVTYRYFLLWVSFSRLLSCYSLAVAQCSLFQYLSYLYQLIYLISRMRTWSSGGFKLLPFHHLFSVFFDL